MYAKIILITDINSKIPIVVERNRVRGILAGDNTSNPKLIFTPINSNLMVGDKLVTSGVAGVFPAGLPVGKIISIKKNEIKIKPSGALTQLEFVKIINYNLDVSNTNVVIEGES